MSSQSTIIYLTGKPGVGKYTIAQALAKKLMHGYEFNSIVSSPLDRALQTAEILNARKLTRKIQIIDELKEACWGEMEGKTKQSSDWINLWRNGRLINGAEKYTDFKKRVAKGLPEGNDVSWTSSSWWCLLGHSRNT